jgi:hypothetical protein
VTNYRIEDKKYNLKCYVNLNKDTLLELPIGNPSSLSNNQISASIKTGAIALTTICEAAKALWEKIDEKPINYVFDKESTIKQLKGFIQDKRDYYNTCWFGSIRQFFSEKFGSISLLNRLIMQIQTSDYE